MYDPKEANKSYLDLLKDRGTTSAIKSALIVISTYVFNKYTNQQDMSPLNVAMVFFFFCIYFSWKPKFIQFLRGYLRGKEFRDKKDD